ncbi:MAG: isoprenylcysteine carboxylmethyltransferase family protein [Phycisphaerales bacterium]|nr:isoprenylcysteine carboxylmethyltransferase family protein [Phycisphaerales bacterium]
MKIRKARLMLLRLSAIPLIILAVFVRPGWAADSVTELSVEFGGYLFLIAGLWIRMWSILYVGGKKSKELITAGPYSLCRNPLYVGSLLLVIGIGLCFENLPMLIGTLVLFVPMHLLVVRLEERHLLDLFPETYPAYQKTVPRFFPSFRNYVSQTELVVSRHAVRRLMVDATAVLLIPQIEDLLEMLHEKHYLPVLWQFP